MVVVIAYIEMSNNSATVKVNVLPWLQWEMLISVDSRRLQASLKLRYGGSRTLSLTRITLGTQVEYQIGVNDVKTQPSIKISSIEYAFSSS